MLSVILAAASTPGCERSADTSTGKKHNVLLVTLDTTRADYLGCYDSWRHGNTPNLDALAEDGVQFTACFSCSAVTPVSHASILTGLYPFQHGLRVIYAGSGYRLKDDVPYLPSVLRAAGWKTAAFLSSFTVSDFYGFDRAFDTFDSGLTRPADQILCREKDGRYMWTLAANQRRSDKTTDAAIRWLEGTDKERPFFLWVHYWDPHDAEAAEPSTLPPPEFLPAWLRTADLSKPGVLRAMYQLEVAYVDSQFGRLIDKLKDLGEYDDTVIAVVSDHGEGLGEHDWWSHMVLYEEQIRVPLIMRVPGWPAGKRIADVVRTVDIYPTILEALGTKAPNAVEGLTLKGLVHGDAGADRIAYAEALNKFDLNSGMPVWRPRDSLLHCVTDGTWKLIWRPDAPDDSELYNLVDDPDEADNLYDAARAEVRRLRAVLESWHPFRTEPFGAAGSEEDERALRALESLGYIREPPATEPHRPAADEATSQPSTSPHGDDADGEQ